MQSVLTKYTETRQLFTYDFLFGTMIITEDLPIELTSSWHLRNNETNKALMIPAQRVSCLPAFD